MKVGEYTEQAVLGSVLFHPEWWEDVSLLSHGEPQNLFRNPENKTLSVIYQNLSKKGITIAEHHIKDGLLKHGMADSDEGVVTILTEMRKRGTISTQKDLQACVGELVEHRNLARMADETEKISEDIKAGRITDSFSGQQALIDIQSKAGGLAIPTSISDDIESVESGTSMKWSVPTGLTKLDDALVGGYANGNIYTIAAGSKVGKTTVMINSIYSALEAGAVVVAISLEVRKEDFVNKLMACAATVDRNQYVSPFMAETDFERKKKILENYPDDVRSSIMQSRSFYKNANLYTRYEKDIDKEHAMESVIPYLSAVKSLHPDAPIVVFIDHVGLMIDRSGRKSEPEQIAMIVDQVATAARALDVAIVQLAQINRDAKSEEPHYYHIRGSATYEHNSSGIILLHRNRTAQINDDGEEIEALDPYRLIVHLALNRYGEPVRFEAFFDGAKDLVQDIEEENDE